MVPVVAKLMTSTMDGCAVVVPQITLADGARVLLDVVVARHANKPMLVGKLRCASNGIAGEIACLGNSFKVVVLPEGGAAIEAYGFYNPVPNDTYKLDVCNGKIALVGENSGYRIGVIRYYAQ